MQYWINHNGVQSGPVDLDALKQMGLTSSAYVWHEGLADWVKITQLPELQGAYIMEGSMPEEPVPPQPALNQSRFSRSMQVSSQQMPSRVRPPIWFGQSSRPCYAACPQELWLSSMLRR